MNKEEKDSNWQYCDKISVYDEHPLAVRDIQYWAPESQSRHKTPFDAILKLCATCETVLDDNDPCN